MDIVLVTNDPAHSLSMQVVAPAADDQSFQMILSVQSGKFCAEEPFWIERFRVKTFVAKLKAMDEDLKGEAVLRAEYGLNEVSLSMTHAGGMMVSGELGSEASSFFKFEFATDQTCLKPLIADLERLLRAGIPAV